MERFLTALDLGLTGVAGLLFVCFQIGFVEAHLNQDPAIAAIHLYESRAC